MVDLQFRSGADQAKLGNQMHRRSVQSAVGFTLIEMLISLSIMAIIATALGSTIVLASRALNQDTSPATATVAARRATDRLLAEVAGATGFTERSAVAVTFTVPDRDGDGLPETIRYAWSGISGDPLTRQYNNGTPDVLLDDVDAFDLSFLLRTTDPPAPKEVESPERLLISHDDAPGGTIREQAIQDKNGCGAYFKPALPGDVIRWKVTRVEFVARKPILASGTIVFSVYAPTTSLKPGTQLLAANTIASTTLPLISSWQSVSFTTLDNLDPTKGLCLTVRTGATSVQGVFQYEEGGTPMTPGTHWMTYNSSTGWSSPQDLSDMRIRVYGTVTTPAP